MELFDTHAHYNDEKFDEDREEVIQAIYDSGVTKLVNAGYSLSSSKKAIEIANNYSWMYVICGISPNDIPDTKQQIDEQVAELEILVLQGNECSQKLVCQKNSQSQGEFIQGQIVENGDKANSNLSKTADNSKKIVAIGEIGLDYYWHKENKDLQKYAFNKQIQLANRLNLPIVIHTREAVDDTLAILKSEMPSIKRGIFHCCPLNRELVKQALNMGFYISFAGPVTFKNSKNADEIIRMVPLDRMVIETDSPYLAPEPHRGTRNDSRNVRFIAEKIASVKHMTVEEIAKQTYQNAETIFELQH